MTDETADDPFDDCELAPDAILGTRTFEDVLFTVETSAHSQATFLQTTGFAYY